MRDDGTIKVLVVEDEPILKMTAMDILEEAGFLVEGASDGREAMEIIQSTPDLHVLFTDVHMPGDMNGLMLARLVSREYPEMGLIIVSGRVAPQSREMPEGAVFVQKPYESKEIVSKILDLRNAA